MLQDTIRLQPKQAMVDDLICNSMAPWIGGGGGRGGAKSAGIDRIMLARRAEHPGTIGAILMRNYDQVKRYHIDVMLREFPYLEPFFHKTDSKLVLPMKSGPDSEIHFTYAESLKDVERRFRSANYYDIYVDQAEQFTEKELREIKQAVRSKGTPMGACKLFLAFNMGGAGIDFLRKKFHLKEYGPTESADDFKFVHFYPWDNIEWSRAALMQDGFITPEAQEHQYYEVFSDKDREEYCRTRSDYGKALNSQDEVLRKRDWFGSWKSLEGSYFGLVYDQDETLITREQVKELVQPWHARWISQDWGKGHYCVTQWHARGVASPAEAKRILGWEVEKPLKFVVTYREYIAGGAAETDEGGERQLGEADIAREIVERTPVSERAMIQDFFLSPDAFEMSVRRVGQNEIAEIMGEVLVNATATDAGGKTISAPLPYPSKADNSRVDGWTLMYNMFLATKRHGAKDEEVYLISVDCPQLNNAIPLLMRDPNNLDDVLKTDKNAAKIEQDCADTSRYGLKSKASPNAKPKEVARKERLSETPGGMTEKYMENLRFEEAWKRQTAPLTRPARFLRGTR
jgi:hypothetical protein